MRHTLSLALSLVVLAATASACKPPASKQNLRTGEYGGGDGTAVPGNDSYLFSVEQARSIRELVEDYRRPNYESSKETSAPSQEQFRSFAESYLNEAMGIVALAPGRDVTVYITDDDQLNAAADGFQRVFINTGTIKAASAVPLLSVLCHELAHSTKNHAAESYEFEQKPEIKADVDNFYDEAEAYFRKSYDDESGTYTHDLAEYRRLLGLWRKVQPQLSSYSKHNESEADIVGGMICGHLGMPVADFISSQNEFMELGDRLDAEAIQGEAIGPEELAQGDQLNLELIDVFLFLFQKDSHPSNRERNQQLNRVSRVIEEHFDGSASLFSRWKTDYEGSSAGLGLTEISFAELAKKRYATTSTGKRIKVARPSCGY